MKSKFTLTKTLAILVLLVTFTAVSAATIKDDSCKTKCCKTKKAKTIVVALAELDKTLGELDTEIRYVTALAITKEVKNALRTIRFEKVGVTTEVPVVFAFDVMAENEIDAKHKINFNALDKEMDQVQEDLSKLDVEKVDATQKIDFTALDKEMKKVQEDLSKMDDGLRCDDLKTRKSAEEILKTGIKS